MLLSGVPTRVVGFQRLSLFSALRYVSTASKATKIGVVGCGNVGSAVAHNLNRSGFQVVAGYDPDMDRLGKMPPSITHAKTPRQVAELCDVIITGLPRPPNVKAAAEGPDGILAGMKPGSVWIDHSTTDCEQTKVYSEEAKSKSSHILEAPITGGLEALRKAQMVVHVGGERDVADAMKPLLDASYNEVFYVGPLGSAMMVKVVSNMLACVHIIAMGEVLMMAKRADVDLKTFWDAIRVSAGNSFVWETGAPLVFKGSYDPGFSMGLQNKDLQLGYDMARKYQVPMDLHGLAFSIYRRTEYQLGEDAGCYSPPKTYEMALNESLNIPNFENWKYDNKIHKGSILVEHHDVE